jgi:hypothetical protein
VFGVGRDTAMSLSLGHATLTRSVAPGMQGARAAGRRKDDNLRDENVLLSNSFLRDRQLNFLKNRRGTMQTQS